MRKRLLYWRWLWEQGYWWFQRKQPDGEWDTRIYEALPRTGKSLFMVRDVIGYLRQGVRVCSNYYIRDIVSGRETVQISSWLDMLRESVRALEDGQPTMFAIDEIHLWCDARAWQSTPSWWLNLMAQRGHYRIGIMGTTQYLEGVEKRFRLLVGRVIAVRPSLLRRVTKWLHEHGTGIPVVPLFATQEEDFMNTDDQGYSQPIGSTWYSWVKADCFHGYSTQELVATMDFAALKDDEVKEEIRELTERAEAAANVSQLPAFADVYAEYREDYWDAETA